MDITSMDLSAVCLVCLNVPQKYTSIFYNDPGTDIQIITKVTSCSNLEIFKNNIEELPEKICNYCLKDLRVAWRFRKNCDRAAEIFASMKIANMGKKTSEDQLQAQNGDMMDRNNDNDDDNDTGEEIANIIMPKYQIAIKPDLNDNNIDIKYIDNDKLTKIKNLNTLQQVRKTAQTEKNAKIAKTKIGIKRNKNNNNKTSQESNSNNNKRMRSRRKAINRPNTDGTHLDKVCQVCGNIYKYQHALIAHMRRHNNDRRFDCEVCSKAFISNIELKRHMRVHTRQKPYACGFCDRRFSDFGSSKKHERMHTGERPYACTICFKTFAYAHVLSIHKRVHTGEKQFACVHCNKGFTKKAYVNDHIKKRCRQVKKETQELAPEDINTCSNSNADNFDINAAIIDNDNEICTKVNITIPDVLEECIVTNDFMNTDDNMDIIENVVDDHDHLYNSVFNTSGEWLNIIEEDVITNNFIMKTE